MCGKYVSFWVWGRGRGYVKEVEYGKILQTFEMLPRVFVSQRGNSN